MTNIFFANTDHEYPTDIDLGKFVSFENGVPSVLTSYFINKIRQITDYTEFVVTNEVQAPDYIAYKSYQGKYAYMWIIMFYNNLLTFDEITYGKTLKIPSPLEINRILAEMKSIETQVKNGIYNFSI